MTPEISQLEKPYWIVVSDEGPARFPFQHPSYQAAYEESIRLSNLKPETKFNVFKYQGHAFSEKPKTCFKTYSEQVTWTTGWNPTYWVPYPHKQEDDGITF